MKSSFIALLLAATAAAGVHDISQGPFDETFTQSSLDEKVNYIVDKQDDLSLRVQASTQFDTQVHSKATMTLEGKNYLFTSKYTYSAVGAKSFSVTATYGDNCTDNNSLENSDGSTGCCRQTWGNEEAVVWGENDTKDKGGSFFECAAVAGKYPVKIMLTQAFDGSHSSAKNWVQGVKDGWRLWFSVKETDRFEPIDYATYVDMTSLMWAETLYYGPNAGTKLAVIRWDLEESPWRLFSDDYDKEEDDLRIAKLARTKLDHRYRDEWKSNAENVEEVQSRWEVLDSEFGATVLASDKTKWLKSISDGQDYTGELQKEWCGSEYAAAIKTKDANTGEETITTAEVCNGGLYTDISGKITDKEFPISIGAGPEYKKFEDEEAKLDTTELEILAWFDRQKDYVKYGVVTEGATSLTSCAATFAAVTYALMF